MKEAILKIQSNLKNGYYHNEASVSQGIVQRLLYLLHWPVYNTNIVSPEYTLGKRRVDFALCHPPKQPVIFIEIKQVGKINGAERQLFEYAFFPGIPMAILTDGQEWQFFLPAEQGDFGERRVYKLDLLERNPDDVIMRLKRYLDYKAVCAGNSIEAARRDYSNVKKERQIKRTFPDAWLKLVEERDELLIELLADKVESLCGYKPSPDGVSTFLTENLILNKISRKKTTYINKKSSIKLNEGGFIFNGEKISAKSARDVIYKVLNIFADHDDAFLDRLVSLPKHGRTRRYVARNREDLNPNRPDLVKKHSHEFRPGWWVNTAFSHRSTAEKILTMACEVAGIKYGKELIVNFGK